MSEPLPACTCGVTGYDEPHADTCAALIASRQRMGAAIKEECDERVAEARQQAFEAAAREVLAAEHEARQQAFDEAIAAVRKTLGSQCWYLNRDNVLDAITEARQR